MSLVHATQKQGLPHREQAWETFVARGHHFKAMFLINYKFSKEDHSSGAGALLVTGSEAGERA